MSKEATDRAWHVFLDAQRRMNEAANRVCQIAFTGYTGTLTGDEALVEWVHARAAAEDASVRWTESSFSDRLDVIAAAGGVAAWWAERHDPATAAAWEGNVDAFDAPVEVTV